MIQVFDNYYVLHTEDTTYAFKVMKSGHLEHLYYGSRITAYDKADLEPLSEKKGAVPCDTCVYNNYKNEVVDAALTLEDVRLEMSSYGKGDIREPFIEVVHADGSFTSDFAFESARVVDKKPEYKTMPTAYNEAGMEGNVLVVTLRDNNYGLNLEITYSVFEKANVITRMTRLINNSQDEITIGRLLSNQLDLDGTGYVLHTFTGAWGREMHKDQVKVTSGKMGVSSYIGTSSNRANPFVMISDDDTTENHGNVYGMNLVYSGNHMEMLEVGSYGKTRFVSGINPQSFEYALAAGEVFEAPEAVMTFSKDGFNKMSRNMHYFVNNHIVRGKYKNAPRPVLINSWEACYFDIDEDKLVALAKKAKEAGVELFVMDDGWFGNRNDDYSSLGDWYVNTTKLPGGLKQLADKINEIGLDFGIWVEPEMINEDSDLYRAHPDWVIRIPGKSHAIGRNQMILDFTREDVRAYITESMRQIFKSANISYVKWDMNRIFTDVYSASLKPSQQGELFHRYVLGFYEVLKTLVEEFPDILFEGCASGGKRFDLGVLSYYPQIWASDDTDAYERTIIQNGYSYGYPQSTYTCHVSDVPNHQTYRITPIETRFNVACFGVMGYECNFNKMDDFDFAAIKEQIAYYKEHRMLFQYGTYYRESAIPDSNVAQWSVVSEDKSEAAALMVQNRTIPNKSSQKLCVNGLADDRRYSITNRKVKYSAKEMGNYDSSAQPIDGEVETMSAYGNAIVNAGVYVMQGFVGTGNNDNIKYYQDLASRIYYISSNK